MEENNMNLGIEQPKYILLNISWREHLLFTISDGMKYIELQANAIRIEGEIEDTNRKEGLKITANHKPVTISYLTEARFKQLRLECLVDPPKEKP